MGYGLVTMSLRFKTNLLEHTKAVGRWAQARGVQAHVRATDLALVLQRGPQALPLLPQFVGQRDGKHLSYFDTPDEHARGFVGWLPYKPLAWDISVSKLAFKRKARQVGLRVPEGWMQPADATAPFLVKRDRGAFGDGMSGPHMPGAAAAPTTVAAGEFCEAFVNGRIARAWYWNGTLAVLEVLPMPQVLGDGQTTLAGLLQQASPEPITDFTPFEALARLQGLGADSVPATGQAVTADYRYVSPLNPSLYANHNLLRQAAGTPMLQAFAEAGARLWPHIPGATGPAGKQAGFVLDAIVGDDGLPWFLEINSNAQGHPDLYGPMLDALCGPWWSTATSLEAAA
jgi:hypothetical protein